MAMMMLVFFFFKQKTAYEMRISDWSSDVCSSDLTIMSFHALFAGTALGVTAYVEHVQLQAAGARVDAMQIERDAAIAANSDLSQTVKQLQAANLQQIGRAACRERGCQYG